MDTTGRFTIYCLRFSFFKQKGTKEVSGNFEKSQPKGKWSFNDLGNINWKFFNDKEGKYIVSAPDDWFYFGVEKYIFLV